MIEFTERMPPRRGRLTMFLDEATFWVKAGDGGRGSTSMRREKFVPRGGPDGGDGGRGGSVYLVANPEKNTLIDFRYRQHFRAEAGGNGGGQRSHGKTGHDLEIPVPPRAIVRTVERDLLPDLVEPGHRGLVAPGGPGGFGEIPPLRP